MSIRKMVSKISYLRRPRPDPHLCLCSIADTGYQIYDLERGVNTDRYVRVDNPNCPVHHPPFTPQ